MSPAPLDIESVLDLETLARTIYEASSDGADAAWMDVCRLGLDALYRQQAAAIADQIRAAVAAHVAAARAEALREAADDFPAFRSPVGAREWLRARAEAETP